MRRQVTLLQRFSLVALAATALLSVVLGLQITASIEAAAVERARNELAEVIRSRRPFWLDAADPGAEFARLHDEPEDYKAWKESIDYMLGGYAIYRIKIWNAAGQVVWSDQPEIIGEVHEENEELREALEGHVESEVASLSKLENASDGIEGKVLELYVPILPRDSFEVIGAFEVYQEITDAYEAITDAQMNAWVLIATMMSAFYLALFTLIANASRTLSRLQRVAQLERYFSPAVAQAIASMGNRVIGRDRQAMLTGRVHATVMFTDIRGFTRHTERMEPEDVVTMLSDYIDLVTSAVFKHGGSVDKFLGDGVLAVFGAPIHQQGHAGKAMEAAEEIRRGLSALNEAREERGEPPIRVGTALATGEVVTGTVGRGAQVTYTVVGNPVNLASRLVGMARPGEVLATLDTLDTYDEAEISGKHGGLHFSGPFTMEVRGRNEPVTIYVSADPAVHDPGAPEGFTVRHLKMPEPSLAR